MTSESPKATEAAAEPATEDLMRWCRFAAAGNLRIPLMQAADRLLSLSRENAELRQQVEALQQQLAGSFSDSKTGAN